MYTFEYNGWNAETTHPASPADTEDPAYCMVCAQAVPDGITFATAQDSWAYGNEITDENSVTHLIVVRKIVEP